MKSTIVAVVVVIALIGLGLWYQSNNQPDIQPLPGEGTETAGDTTGVPAAGENTSETSVNVNGSTNLEITTEDLASMTITYSGSSFSTASIDAKVGDTVIFANNGSSAIRVSSNPHPVHSDHPEFDSGSLAPDSTWAFTFSEAGTYSYHNHLSPGATGQITVK